MNQIITAKKTFDEYNNQDIIFEGRNSKFYQYSDTEILKKLKHPVSSKKAYMYQNMENDSFSFPTAAIHVNSKIRALVYNYFDGVTLKETAPCYGNNENIDHIVLAVKKLCEDIIKLSNEKILTEDVNLSDILWDKKNFKVIDTIQYNKTILSKDYVAYLNLRNIIDPIMFWLISDKMYEFLAKSEIKKEFFNTSNVYCFDQMILDIKNYLENYLDTSITTFGEAEKKLILKK